MKITETDQMEFNPEVTVTLKLQQLKTLVAIVGRTSDSDAGAAVAIAENYSDLGDHVKYATSTYPIYQTLCGAYSSAPKVPEFTPITFTIESEEELAALRIATGRLSTNVIEGVLFDLDLEKDANSIMTANCKIFDKFDTIFSGKTK